jgi:hypothetical protein
MDGLRTARVLHGEKTCQHCNARYSLALQTSLSIGWSWLPLFRQGHDVQLGRGPEMVGT